MVIVDLVDRDKIVKKIETAARDAQGPPPTFSDLKKMMETEEGQLTLLMHQMNAFAQFLPGGRDASRDIYNRL